MEGQSLLILAEQMASKNMDGSDLFHSDMSASNYTDQEIYDFIYDQLCAENFSEYRCLPMAPEMKQWALTEIVVIGIIAAFGLIGNCLTLIVLMRDKKRSSTNLILMSLAICDILSLILTLLNSIIRNFVLYNQENAMYKDYATPFAKSLIYGLIPLQYSAVYGSIVFTVMVTIDRYVAVCKPMAVRKNWHVTVAIIALAGFVLIFYLPKYFEYGIFPYIGIYRENWFVGSSIDVITIQPKDDFSRSKEYQIIYRLIAFTIFRFIGPVLLLIVFNIKLYKALRAMRKRYLKMRRGSSHAETRRHVTNNESLTFTIVVVVATFLILNFPSFVNNTLQVSQQIIIEFLGHNHDAAKFLAFLTSKPYLMYYITIANAFTILDSSINFFIYIIFAKKFRKIFLDLCCSKQFAQAINGDIQLSSSSDVKVTQSNCRSAVTTVQISPADA